MSIIQKKKRKANKGVIEQLRKQGMTISPFHSDAPTKEAFKGKRKKKQKDVEDEDAFVLSDPSTKITGTN